MGAVADLNRKKRLLAALKSSVAVAGEVEALLMARKRSGAMKLLGALAGNRPGYRQDTDEIHAALNAKALQRTGPKPGVSGDEIAQLYADGFTRRQIASIKGVAYEVVRRRLAETLKGQPSACHILDGKSPKRVQ